MAKTIMVVDDSEVMRQVVGTTLRDAGYDVIEGEDGRDALSKLTGQRVHLFISDLNMPHLDGIGFVRECLLRHFACPSTPKHRYRGRPDRCNRHGRISTAQVPETGSVRPKSGLSSSR